MKKKKREKKKKKKKGKSENYVIPVNNNGIFWCTTADESDWYVKIMQHNYFAHKCI